ncbi:hypothetical protein MBAV_002580 [Candidatus Magnetobacterium bavaricum]|uniref:Uncharacterized protein n=1 Tax=Candidatus Magnetobacterium bavaricum TaxID=29290 RepID=A0A0F3GTM6_9BACT|nr:hypothetical protein MBAV_002580 [Candidatus Magnetobacterium bavaricum]
MAMPFSNEWKLSLNSNHSHSLPSPSNRSNSALSSVSPTCLPSNNLQTRKSFHISMLQ